MATTSAQVRFAVKFKEASGKRFWFLASGGYGNRLRIHAMRFESKEAAQQVADEIAQDNEGIVAKVVTL